MPYFLIALTVVMRFLPHPFNLTPIGGLGLFAGAYCGPRFAWFVPLLALAIGDAMDGFYDPVVLVFVYLGFLAGPLMGRLLLAQRRTARRFLAAVFSSASLFFVLSNFGIWLAGFYPLTPTGLIECYINAIPFFVNTLLADLLYGGILFGGAKLARHFMGIRDPATDG